ncbi:8-oxoguanine DNA glycosylase OGG fold protein [Streptomyces sp. NPDC002076]
MAGDASWPENGWTTDQYGQYLTALHDHAQKHCVAPDQVEAALFSRGQ